MELSQILDSEIGRVELSQTREVIYQDSAPRTKVYGDIQGGYAPLLGLAAVAMLCAGVGVYYAGKKLIRVVGERFLNILSPESEDND